jgi:uncharacterized membrane protein
VAGGGTWLAEALGVAIPGPVHDNLQSIAQLRERVSHGVSVHQRLAETIAGRVGRPAMVYAFAGCVIGWIAYNSLAPRMAWRTLDPPPFVWLQGAIALFAAFTTTLVLVAQTRQRAVDDQRAHLELQINLLAEQKTTKIIALLEELRRDLPDVRDREDPVADAMQEEIDPCAVHSAIHP